MPNAKPKIFWLTPDRFDKKPDKSSWLEMARSLKQQGWEVAVVAGCADRATAPDYDGIVTYVGSIDKPLLFRITTMLSTLLLLMRASKRGDILIINEDSLWLLPLYRLLGRRHIHLDIRTFPVFLLGLKSRINRLLFFSIPTRLLAPFADSYSFITERLLQAYRDEFNQDPQPRCIWQSGVSLELFHNQSHTKPAQDTYTVLYHGSLYLSRGVSEVIESLALVSSSANVVLRIVGDGQEVPELKRRAHQYGVDAKVEFCGFVPYEQVVQEIHKADVCVCPLPDRPEWNMSSPLKVLEYLACGKPMILTRIPAHQDIVGDAPFVVWAEETSAQGIAEAIEHAVSQRESIAEMALAGPDYVKGKFEWHDHARCLGALLDDATAQP